jgi:hypothetical protein
MKLYSTLFEFWNDVDFNEAHLVTPVKVFDCDGDFMGYKKEYI